jgi:siroheme synthase-like protein
MEQKYFPLFISMEQKKVLLFGAGNIAIRRARGLLEFGATLTVIAPEISDGFFELKNQYAEQIKLCRRTYNPGEIKEADIVLSATDDPTVDFSIYNECKEKKIPVNIASDQTLCDFQFPALITQDNLVIGVNSGGSDHHKVRKVSAVIRDILKK